MSDVLITGGSRGIGEALVRLLASDGRRVSFTYCRGEERAGQISRETGAECFPYDLTSKSSVEQLADRVVQGVFTALVNNALSPSPRKLFVKTDPDEAVGYLADGVYGVIRLSQALVQSLKQRGKPGAIVNVLSSVTLGLPPSRLAPYVTAKYALLGLTRGMAVELIAHGVRVNAVSPGMTRTDFNAELPEPFVRQVEERLPMGRLAAPEEVARAIRFLLSDDAGYMNGVNIPVTGGERC